MFTIKLSKYLSKNLIRNYKNFCSTTKTNNFPRKIFSGIQPTGAIHLGNYLGAIKQWVELQNSDENIILMIADLHSITLPYDTKTLSNKILQLTATLLACGIDPNKVLLFQQSSVPAHSELNWYLGCISTMARLAHLPQFKEKSADIKNVPLGLYVYPVLQTADILSYKATHVPVGEDQEQHIQLAQELAKMFNSRFGETFPIPHAIVVKNDYARLKSLRDPLKKMSKSDPDPKSRISLTDSPNEIMNKIKKSVTDCISEVSYDPEKRPGVSNLISIHSVLSGKNTQEICQQVANINTGQYKMVVSDAIISYIKPIQEKITNYINDPQYLIDVLEFGAGNAKEMSEKTLEEVKNKLGLLIKLKRLQKIGVIQT